MLYNQQLINLLHPPQVSISICRLEIQSPSGTPPTFQSASEPGWACVQHL